MMYVSENWNIDPFVSGGECDVWYNFEEREFLIICDSKDLVDSSMQWLGMGLLPSSPLACVRGLILDDYAGEVPARWYSYCRFGLYPEELRSKPMVYEISRFNFGLYNMFRAYGEYFKKEKIRVTKYEIYKEWFMGRIDKYLMQRGLNERDFDMLFMYYGFNVKPVFEGFDRFRDRYAGSWTRELFYGAHDEETAMYYNMLNRVVDGLAGYCGLKGICGDLYFIGDKPDAKALTGGLDREKIMAMLENSSDFVNTSVFV